MKTKILLLAVSVSVFELSAQQWNWAKNCTYGSQNSGTGIGTDSAQNIYVTGYSGSIGSGPSGSGSSSYNMLWKFDISGNLIFTDTLEIGGSSVCDTNGNVFFAQGDRIAKYDSNGNQLWILTLSGGSYSGITLHSSGGFVIVGKTTIGVTQSIVSRYDANGILIWTKTGDFFPGGSNLKCDNLGNIYIVGGGPLDSASGNRGFLIKYSESGSLLFNKPIPATVSGIAIDNTDNIYVTGWFSLLSINILGTTYSSNPPISPVPQFLIKYNPVGNILWYKLINGQLGKSAITADNNGNIYFTNSYSTLTIDSLSLIAPTNTTNLFVMKADSAGTILWYKNSTANVPDAYAYAPAICFTGNDGVLMAGTMNKSSSFGLHTLTQISTQSDLLIAKIGYEVNTNTITEVIPHRPIHLNQFSVYPNPGQGLFQLTYRSSTAKQIQINVFNASGVKVHEEAIAHPQSLFTKTINLSREAKGTYYVEIITESKKSVEKIILN